MNVIEIKNLSKKYFLDKQYWHEGSTVRDKIFSDLKNVFSKNSDSRKSFHFALKDINLSIERGEILGVIGQNGAGKSTLLKILSKITQPTSGIAKIKGRVTSLLEVGTGIHTELSGRDNVYLNGATLGMKKNDIDKKFDKIVDFSGVRKFIDIPMKKYSSGMQVRLAFAVAAHVNSDILLVDEVLAVGDLNFRKQSMEKMTEITKDRSRTILFVSHDMGAIRNLCSRCVYLKNGEIKKIGETSEVIDYYIKDCINESDIGISLRQDRNGTRELFLVDFFGEDNLGKKTNCFLTGQSMRLKFFLKAKKGFKSEKINFYVGFNSDLGIRVMTLSNEYTEDLISNYSEEKGVELFIPKFPLVKGEYTLDVTIRVNGEITDNIVGIGRVSVEAGGFYKHESLVVSKPNRGSVMTEHCWKIFK